MEKTLMTISAMYLFISEDMLIRLLLLGDGNTMRSIFWVFFFFSFLFLIILFLFLNWMRELRSTSRKCRALLWKGSETVEFFSFLWEFQCRIPDRLARITEYYSWIFLLLTAFLSQKWILVWRKNKSRRLR